MAHFLIGLPFRRSLSARGSTSLFDLLSKRTVWQSQIRLRNGGFRAKDLQNRRSQGCVRICAETWAQEERKQGEEGGHRSCYSQRGGRRFSAILSARLELRETSVSREVQEKEVRRARWESEEDRVVTVLGDASRS